MSSQNIKLENSELTAEYVAHVESISKEVNEGNFISHDDILENME